MTMAGNFTIIGRVLAVTFAVTAPILAQAPPRPASAIGVLVGLHRASGDPAAPSIGQLRTLWMAGFDTGKPARPQALPDLLVPRRSGFWRLGLAGWCEEEEMTGADDRILGTGVTISDRVWTAPVGQEPRNDSSPCAARNVLCVNDWTTSVYWVWPEYASLEMGERGECGVHPDWTPGYTVIPVGDVGKRLSVGTVLGTSAEDVFRKAFEREPKDDDACAEEAVFNPSSWYIEREAGRWKATGWTTTHRVCGYGIDYVVDADLTAITGRRDDGALFERLKARLPQITDAHSSPGGKWALVTTKTELMIVDTTSPARPLRRIPKSASESLVMVEWATGPNVARWSTEVARLARRK
jgi:hypothetical protein